MTLYLSRARLRRDAALDALAALLLPAEPGARVGAAHRLVWSLFAGDPAQRRDFLWREDKPGSFLLLSARPPADPHGLFELDAPKEFSPALTAGDRLQFTLRANATVAPSSGPDRRRSDVVMHALRDVPRAERGSVRSDTASTAGRDWLARQGAAHGFAPDEVAVLGYDSIAVARLGARPARFGVLELEGRLTVRDPAAFVARLAAGFGRAKSFGCGLMLIRRARAG